MQRTILLLALSTGLAACVGCSGDAADVPASVSQAPQSAQETLIGRWDGTFQLNEQAAAEELDAETISTLKSIRMSVEFKGDGNMNMAATMQTSEGPLENQSAGQWEIVSEQGDQVTIRSTEPNAEPEDIHVRIADANTLLMSPPQGQSHIGVIRFQRR